MRVAGALGRATPPRPRATGRLVTGPLGNDGRNNRSLARPRVEVQQDDLLVLAGQEFAVGERDGETGADERGAYVAVAVVVVPGGFVLVAGVVGDQALEDRGQVV